MTIDDAIKCLELAKQRGVKSVVLAYWGAPMFGRVDDDAWEDIAKTVEEQMDWSRTHDDLSDLVSQDEERG